MSTGGILLGGFDAVSLDGLEPDAHGFLRVCGRVRDRLLNRGVNQLEVMPLLNFSNIPTQRSHGFKGGLHGKRIRGDASRQLGVVVGNDHDEGIDSPLASQTRDSRKGLFGFTFHGGSVRHQQHSDSLVPGQLVSDGQTLGLTNGGTQRSIGQKNSLGVEMRFTVAGQLGLDASETLQGLGSHSVKTIIGADGINAVLRMPGVVDEVVGLVPGAIRGREEHTMDSGADLSEGRRSTPVAGGTANNCMNIHERDQGPCCPRIGQGDGVSGSILDLSGVAGESRSWCQTGFQDLRAE